MSAESNEKAPAKSVDAVPAHPPLTLVPAPFAFGLALAWSGTVVAFIDFTNSHPRYPDDMIDEVIVWVLRALFVACPLVWIGYTAWHNRDGFRAWPTLRRVGGGVRIVLQPVYWILGCLIAILLSMPRYADYTLRAKMSEVVLAASGFKTPIVEWAAEKGTLTDSGTGLSVTPGGRVTAGLVSHDGLIVLYNSEFRMLITLVPEVRNDGRVRWTCDGMLEKHVPAECRQGKTSHASRERGSANEDVQELLKPGAVWQSNVARAALSQGTLTSSAKTTIVRRDGLVDFALLDTNGRIALYSDRHGVFALLEPQLKSAQITWRCRVWPAKVAPPGCAPEP